MGRPRISGGGSSSVSVGTASDTTIGSTGEPPSGWPPGGPFDIGALVPSGFGNSVLFLSLSGSDIVLDQSDTFTYEKSSGIFVIQDSNSLSGIVSTPGFQLQLSNNVSIDLVAPSVLVNGNAFGTAAFSDSRSFASLNDAPPRVILTGVVSNTSLVVPAGYVIRDIFIYNTTANAVTGGVNFGQTPGASDVAATAVGGSAFVLSTILIRIFSAIADQTVYVSAGASWNSANLDIVVTVDRAIP